MLVSAKLAPCFPYPDLERFWRDADAIGFHAVWSYDHFYGLADPKQDTFEGWTILAAMAKVVTRARVGCMVTGVTYRHPALLANMAVTVDHISGGRLEFGLGAAWHEGEHRGYGIDFPSNAARVAMLDEALGVIRALWTQEETDHEGRFFRLEKAICNPKPVQRPHPPIVAGGAKPKIMRVIARHANEWNFPAVDPAAFAAASKELDAACAEVGRDPAEIRRSVQLFVHPAQEGQPESMLELLPGLAEAGAEHVVLSFYQPPARALLETMAAAGA